VRRERKERFRGGGGIGLKRKKKTNKKNTFLTKRFELPWVGERKSAVPKRGANSCSE